MEWLKPLRGAVVGLDTAPLIYFIEENPLYLPLVRPFFEAIDRGEFRLVTSVLTLTEVLIHPMRSLGSGGGRCCSIASAARLAYPRRHSIGNLHTFPCQLFRDERQSHSCTGSAENARTESAPTASPYMNREASNSSKIFGPLTQKIKSFCEAAGLGRRCYRNFWRRSTSLTALILKFRPAHSV